MPANERKYWPTARKHIHILGEVRQVKHGTGRIAALYLYEKSVLRRQEPAELPPVRARAIIGASAGLVCTICGQTIDWDEPQTESYLRLITHYPDRAGA